VLEGLSQDSPDGVISSEALRWREVVGFFGVVVDVVVEVFVDRNASFADEILDHRNVAGGDGISKRGFGGFDAISFQKEFDQVVLIVFEGVGETGLVRKDKIRKAEKGANEKGVVVIESFGQKRTSGLKASCGGGPGAKDSLDLSKVTVLDRFEATLVQVLVESHRRVLCLSVVDSFDFQFL